MIRMLPPIVALAIVAAPRVGDDVGRQIEAGPRHRGVSWVGGPEIDRSALVPLSEHHVEWIVQTPFGWQNAVDSTEVRTVTGGRIYWGESDVGLEATTRMARELGIKTLLKPHVWLRRDSRAWRSDIAMKSEADWRTWFDSYRDFILHYARLAARLEIEALCVGTELRQTVVQKPEEWRRLIAEIRKIYSGELTYAANWYAEFEEVSFWGDLDYIGIQGYFPLSDEESPGVAELVKGWQPHLASIDRVRQRFDKPVIFTEIGYKSVPNTAIEPWVWSSRNARNPVDYRAQENAYEAFFTVFWNRPWVAGAYFWKWFPDPSGRDRSRGFTPQGKPAAKVLAGWYSRSAESEVGSTVPVR